MLEQALRDEPGNTRYAFYLAQSLRDAGRLQESREAYRRRAAMGGWDEECWFAVFQVAVLTERLDGPPHEVREAYLAAYAQRPARAEPLCELARYHRLRSEFALAHLYAQQAARMPRPADILFVDAGVYAWRSLDELAVSAFYVQAFEQGPRGTAEAAARAALSCLRDRAHRGQPALLRAIGQMRTGSHGGRAPAILPA